MAGVMRYIPLLLLWIDPGKYECKHKRTSTAPCNDATMLRAGFDIAVVIVILLYYRLRVSCALRTGNENRKI